MTRSKRRYAVPRKKIDSAEFPKHNKIAITKLDAALRQLETAITLWFHDADPVSIHVLAMSAHEVLRAINKSRAGKPMMLEDLNLIRPEYQEALSELFVRHYQFFKHGTRDPQGTTWFAPQVNQAVILDAVEAYSQIASQITPLFRTFITYLSVHHPEYFQNIRGHVSITADLRSLSKSQFFVECLPVSFRFGFDIKPR